ncbi:hypothetical protein [Paludisphaera rhizosphaerae]|uniref:hypothetical protein n=1 Tax=Paludisphaera rhizosphaerae TaxID=2711216 RepID=UPI0013EDE373|nr:hypothetical protein [Paludisphaera rhizosphaerae]
MSFRLVRAAAETETTDDYHLGRLLILLRSSDHQKNSPATKLKAVEGITKLAKLDFLLRYPTCLERALRLAKKNPNNAQVQPRERTSIESKMIRFRYGPWDPRYRRWLGLLSARGLVQLQVSGKTVQIGLTDPGRDLADVFRGDPLYDDVKRRSDVIAKAFGGYSATKLKDFVYEVVPEIIDLKWGEEITTGTA